MIVTILIPIRRGDGTYTTEREQDTEVVALGQEFGGVTNEGPVMGYWWDANDVCHRDTSIKVRIAIRVEQLGRLREAVRKIGQDLGQDCMYFEISNARMELVHSDPVKDTGKGTGDTGGRGGP